MTSPRTPTGVRTIRQIDVERLPAVVELRGSRPLGGLAFFFGLVFTLLPAIGVVLERDGPTTRAVVAGKHVLSVSRDGLEVERPTRQRVPAPEIVRLTVEPENRRSRRCSLLLTRNSPMTTQADRVLRLDLRVMRQANFETALWIQRVVLRTLLGRDGTMPSEDA